MVHKCVMAECSDVERGRWYSQLQHVDAALAKEGEGKAEVMAVVGVGKADIWGAWVGLATGGAASLEDAVGREEDRLVWVHVVLGYGGATPTQGASPATAVSTAGADVATVAVAVAATVANAGGCAANAVLVPSGCAVGGLGGGNLWNYEGVEGRKGHIGGLQCWAV